MIKIILLLVFMYDGELKVERIAFDTPKQCQEAFEVVGKKLSESERFERGILAACVESKVREM